MSIHVALHHRTHYKYARPVQLSPQVIRLRPAPHNKTRILSYSLKVSPKDHFMNWLQDPQGNFLARVVFPEKVSEFKVEVDLVTEMAILNPFDFFLEPYAEHFPFSYREALADELEPFMDPPVDTGPRFQKRLAAIPRDRRHVVDFLVDLNRELEKETRYLIRMEAGVQTPEETLEKASGSCRDSAWLLINLLRGLGFASRFVSGYLIQLTPDQKSLDGPSGPESDFTDLHAWAEVFLPGAGWIGLDPTSGLLAGEGHIPLACAPAPLSAAPITGELEDVETEFDFHMEVNRIYESARVTRPYLERDWESLEALGRQIDADLKANDVRLTMGGEPTFISIDDMDGEEWNVAAIGPDKRRLSEALFKRLFQRFAKGGFLHYGQGKWYPGESLPRWAFTCYWHPGGKPLWHNRKLQGEIEKNYGLTNEDGDRFLKHFARVLEVDPDHVMPAYEDPFYFLWKEQKLPANVDTIRNKLKNPEDRTRLARVFSSGLDAPRGCVLPLQRWWQARARAGWISGRWPLRESHLFLIPGDSPVGLRLPLESLPWVPANSYPHVGSSDPSYEATQSLPDWESHFQVFLQRAQDYLASASPQGESRPGNPQELPSIEEEARLQPGDPGTGVVRTAICVEVRDGKLFVFMPPVRDLRDYIELLVAVEATAESLDIPVLIEGEKPPEDPRLANFSITPDPGVIEVNIHPSETWDELVERTEALYEEARLSRLGTNKFMIDGRHTGTGGGNHLVLGGPTPLDSPFLRRPDLLRSMVAYWQLHPALSYFFSGLFIGPTSQSPRFDEGRNDSIYEMEIAFREVDRQLPNLQPWLVDRIFRNLLIDLTGNTHRAEFCIDKLYSPDSSGGRRGLLELRSFEMPPHARMSLAQQLLVRGLILLFWKQPFSPRRLTRWGCLLQDKFMLPYFLMEDLREVLADLREAGMPFCDRWFDPHFEFRFPLYGNTAYRDGDMEIRHALEPWHVLGEEGHAGNTVRFVDSSVERLQVKVSGLDPERYLVACNGRVLPMQPAGDAATRVSGVRFRAWQPASCLHPTIPVDTPLVFDLVDRHAGRAVAGCTYHVAHPGGRNYDTFPINAYEAESRRLARFEPHGHSPGPWSAIPEPEPNPDFPHTLDLRR